MAPTVHAKALHRAAEVLGGKHRLREHLRVPMANLESWMSGAAMPPMDIFLKAVDIISAAPPAENGAAADAVLRSRQVRRASGVLRSASELTRQRSVQIQAAILAARDQAMPKRAAYRSALAFLQARFEPADGKAMVEAALDAALTVTDAEMGDVQLLCPGGLRIVAHRGLEQPFLDFFERVTDGPSACAVAMREHRRVVVADVASDPIYAGTPAADVMAHAHIVALQSTPLLGDTGQLLGVLSTLYNHPRHFSARDLDPIDHIARRTAFWLDGGAL